MPNITILLFIILLILLVLLALVAASTTKINKFGNKIGNYKYSNKFGGIRRHAIGGAIVAKKNDGRVGIFQNRCGLISLQQALAQNGRDIPIDDITYFY